MDGSHRRHDEDKRRVGTSGGVKAHKRRQSVTGKIVDIPRHEADNGDQQGYRKRPEATGGDQGFSIKSEV
jgi:hypothetical protein